MQMYASLNDCRKMQQSSRLIPRKRLPQTSSQLLMIRRLFLQLVRDYAHLKPIHSTLGLHFPELECLQNGGWSLCRVLCQKGYLI